MSLEHGGDRNDIIFESDIELLTFGGVVIAVVWLTSIVEHRFSGAWESHRTATEQWFAIGALFLSYACVSAFFAGFASKLRRRLFGLLLRMTGSLRLLRWIFVGIVAVAGMAALVATLMFFYIPPWRAVAWVTVPGIIVWCALACADAALWHIVRNMLGRAASFVRGLGLTCDVGSFWKFVYRTVFVAILLATASWIVVDAHRSISLVLGFAQGLILQRLGARHRLGFGLRTAIVVASMVAWVFAGGFTYTPIAEWALGATETTAGSAIVFVATLALVTAELYFGRRISAGRNQRVSLAIALIAIGCFIELGFRTDHLYSDWVPYHRSFWVGPADFVKQGAWLLWDIPSQYGFLSAISLAVWPTSSTWQALYQQTAITLAFDAAILFSLLRFGRRGALNAVFSIVVTATLFFTSLSFRPPFGWRLYPQVGLRFTGLIALLGVTFLLYRWRDESGKRRLGYAAGFVVWTVSILWSFESGVIATLVWLPFVLLDLGRDLFRIHGDLRAALHTSFKRLVFFALVPSLLFVALEAVYRWRLGHGPDWSAYVEFALKYNVGDTSREPIQIRGPGWVLLTFLIACGAATFRAARKGAVEALPVLVACWLGLWVVCNYYIAEGFNNHVNGLAPVLATVFAVLLAVHRAEGRSELLTLPMRALATPLLVLLISQAVTPDQLRTIVAPLRGNYSPDGISKAPEIRGELARLLEKAQVHDTDLIVYPVSVWEIKTDLGLILPFVRSAKGNVVQQYAWLPLSPIGPYDELHTLPPGRIRVYLHRFYAQVHKTGWLITYHQPVDCGRLIPGLLTTEVHRSTNYQIARCRSGDVSAVRR